MEIVSVLPDKWAATRQRNGLGLSDEGSSRAEWTCNCKPEVAGYLTHFEHLTSWAKAGALAVPAPARCTCLRFKA